MRDQLEPLRVKLESFYKGTDPVYSVVPKDATFTISVHTIIDCGCYTCETGITTGPVNEAGQYECMAQYTFADIFVDGEFLTSTVVYENWD